MKLHDFIIEYTEERGKLLYNPLTEAVLFFPEQQEIKEENMDQEAIAYLKEHFFIDQGDSSTRFGTVMYDRIKYSNKKISLIIHTNYTCNLECIYCYQKGITEEKLVINQKTIEQFHAFFERIKKNNNLEVVDLCFIGGEPLLCSREVQQIYDIACKVFKNLKITTSIITNGTLVLKEIGLLDSIRFDCIQVTLDGGEITHNKLRRSRDKNDSYRGIVKKLFELQKRGDYNVVINCNLSPQSEQSVDELIKDLQEQNIKYPLIFSLVFSGSQNNCKNTVISSIRQEKSWVNAHIHAMNFGYTFQPFYRNPHFSCGLFKENSFCIAPDGMIYKCISGISLDEYKVCHISEYGSQKYINHVSQFTEAQKQCEKSENGDCKYRLVCDGGCFFKNQQEGWRCSKNQIANGDLKVLYETVCRGCRKG